MNCTEKFYELFGGEAQNVAFCPYRVCPLGAHVDHQLGHINGFAIDCGISFAWRATESGSCTLYSLQFEGARAEFDVNDVPKIRLNDWADYLRGAALQLLGKYELRYGVEGVFEGSFPIGGLSSSAAVTMAFITALAEANGITQTAEELIMTAKLAENEYVGVNCGTLDQSCEALCRKGQLLYMDTRDGSYSLIKDGNPDYAIAVFFSGLEHALKSSGYNARQDECKAAAYVLKGYAGTECGVFKDAYLRDVPREVFDKYGDRLPDNLRKRAEHFYTEDARAVAGPVLWAKGDLAGYGRLINESGRSSIFNYEAGSPELKTMCEIISRTDGVYGARFSGAGFKGCCMALIDPAFADSIQQCVESEYKAAYPQLAPRYMSRICKTGDGIASK